MRKKICMLLVVTLLSGTLFSCHGPGENSGQEKEHFIVQLDHDYWLSSVGTALMEHFPDVEFDFVISRGGAQYLNDAVRNDALADIIIDESAWTQTSIWEEDSDINPEDYLYDFAWTDITGMFYKVYLDNFTNRDGTINWLPGAASIEGILANKNLFEQYGIDIPVDYPTFVEACEQFAEYGIRGFATDYKYDYTDSYMLQAWSIPLLQSAEGRKWRVMAMSGKIDYLPEELGVRLFSRLGQVLVDTNVEASDIERGYSKTFEEFTGGRIAMIRQSTNIAEYQAEGMDNLILLPFFGETEEDNWYFSTPGYSVAMNRKLSGAGRREEKALDIVRYLFSNEVMNAMAQRTQSFIVYNKNVSVDIQDTFANVKPYVESNRMYTYIRSDNVSKASYAAVSHMILGNTDPEEACEVFNKNFTAVKESAETVAVFDKRYAWTVKDSGSEAFSARVNTLRQISGTELLIAPAAMNSGDIYEGTYTSAQLKSLLMSGAIYFYTKQSATGAEIKNVVRCLVEGCGRDDDPVSWDTLPASSGFVMQILQDDKGEIHLEDILVEGKPIDDTKEYSFCYVDVSGHILLEQAYNYDMSEHGGQHMFKSENDISGEEQYDGYISSKERVAKLWVDYFQNGGQLIEPCNYIEKVK
ncbi:MAG: ABC transporter substrate-binding protein [Clostridia bacterium]|nr:ABC transporter substrate-binding protein [Clostridia bacterium]